VNRIAFLFIAGACLVGRPSFGQTSHAGGEGLFDVRSATVPSAGSYRIALTGARYRVHPEEDPESGLERTVWNGGFTGAVGALDWLEIFGRYDAVFYSAGDDTPISPADGLVGGKALLPWSWHGVQSAVAGSTTIPWGNVGRGYTSDAFDPALQLITTIPLPESSARNAIRVHVNLGYRWRNSHLGNTFEDTPTFYFDPAHPRTKNDQVDLRTAFEVNSRSVTLFAELLLDDLQDDDIAFQENPLFLTPGFRVRMGDSFRGMLGSKIALASDKGSTTRWRAPEDMYPDWQIVFGLEWSRVGPEDADHDADGVLDFKDRCPREAEDRDGFQDEDGCPDLDDDGDGIVDAFDTKPREAEDVDGWQDSDGVPDPDNDGDSIADVADSCSNEAEDYDMVQDADGCPETDADQDGVPDMSDKCPEEAESLNGVEDADGCPEKVGLAEPSVLRGVQWDGMDVAPTSASFTALNDLVDQLKKDPNLRIEIRVHPNLGLGSPGALFRLSSRRAEYLRGFLVASGIDPSRIIASSGGGLGAPLDKPENGPFVGTAIAEIIPQRNGKM
jgi:hypothetical protein